MKRWLFSIVLIVAPVAALSIVVGAHVSQPAARFEIIEATIPGIQDALRRGDLTSRDLVDMYLARIERYEPLLNAVISINPRARSEAETLDAERAMGFVRGPLHGIPIAIKDNINTTGMPTTAGALAFEGYTPPYDATLVTHLHLAGAIIIAKTVLTEFANFMSFNMPANYSAVGGYGMNPYDPRPDPRAGNNDGRPALTPGGSSSGIGTAANLWVANVGTETNGSILSPSVQNMLVGIKPTVGLISRYGILPLTADQDTAGPLARTVTDAAILLGAMTGPDPRDSPIGTHACGVIQDYTSFLRRAGLQGARIGIPRANFYNPIVGPDGVTRGGLNAAQQAVMNEAIQILRQEGAVLVDPADIPSIVDGTPANNLLLFPSCTARAANCSLVSYYGFKRDFAAYLASLGSTAPVRSLTEDRQFNIANASRNSMRYGQERLDLADQMDLVADRARYEADLAKNIYLTSTHGMGEVMQRNNLDALVIPGSSGAGLAALPGHPTVVVPFGQIPNAPTNPAFPAGFDARPAPYGVSFTSMPCTEGRLIEMAYAFEQATKRRVPPPSTP